MATPAPLAGTAADLPPLPAAAPRQSRLGALFGADSIARDPLMVLSSLVLLIMVVLAVFAPLIAPQDPNVTNILNASTGPSPAHWFGTDSLGRDLFSRVIYGARLSLLGPALVIAVATVLGVTLAIVGAWVGGRLDAVLARINDVLLAFPGLLLALLAVALLGTGLTAPVIALAIAYTPYIYRVVRTVALRERNLAYVEASRMLGHRGVSICTRHLLPNLLPIIRAQATLSFGSALADLAAVSFLGLGVQAPTAEWGLMVANGQSELVAGHPSACVAPGIFIIVSVIAANVLGERLAERAEER